MLSDTRGRVLDAAVACLVRNGFGGTTARAIAQTGGFAPGVIYYHFADLDDLLVAALAHTCESRAQRYRAVLAGVDRAGHAVDLLRALYREDTEVGHVAAVQEIYAGARPGSRLAAQLALETRRWEELAEELLTTLLRGKPLASAVRVPVLASGAVALFLGVETLTHLDGNRSRPAALFDQAARLAAVFDRIPRLRRRAEHRVGSALPSADRSPAPALPMGEAVHVEAAQLREGGQGEPLWHLVRFRLDGEWRSGLLTARRELLDGTTVAHIRWGAGPDDQAWILDDPDTVRPLPPLEF